MKKVILQRYKENHNQTTGVLLIVDGNGWPLYASPCIERGDRNNAVGVSNVLPGTYDLVLEYSPRFERDLWELYGTQGRSECKIHASNYWHQLNGCIAPGNYLKDLNGDNYQDVAQSRLALNNFHRVMGDMKRCKIEIIDPR